MFYNSSDSASGIKASSQSFKLFLTIPTPLSASKKM